MDVAQLQREVAAFVDAHAAVRLEAMPRVLDLASETGELAKEVLKGTDYGHTPFVPTERWQDELGDEAFALICLADSTGVDLKVAVVGALVKYEARFAASGDISS